MMQWEIYDYSFPDPIGSHPAIVLSPTEVADNPDIHFVNVLMVVSVRAARPMRKFEVALNGADGLDNLSVAKVLPVYLVAKMDLGRKRGLVTRLRQQALAGRIREAYRLA
jgi:mRNA-degrading endonuclease toxin of MazEF toxin-antitoxin module